MNNSPTITLEWVRQQKAKHKAVLADLEATERVLLSATVPEPALTSSSNGQAAVRHHGGKRRTLLHVIADSSIGLTTAGAIVAASKRGVENLTMANVSPKLSESKSDGLLQLDGGVWKITDKGREFLASGTN